MSFKNMCDLNNKVVMFNIFSAFLFIIGLVITIAQLIISSYSLLFFLGSVFLLIGIYSLNFSGMYFTITFEIKKIPNTYDFQKLPYIFSVFLRAEISTSSYSNVSLLLDDNDNNKENTKQIKSFKKALIQVLNGRRSIITYLDLINAHLLYKQYFEPQILNDDLNSAKAGALKKINNH